MANTKGSALPAMTTPVGTDIFIAVDDPGGTPATQKVTFANAWTNYFKGQADSVYSVLGHSHAPGDIAGGTFADTLIAASNITQHQAALSITESQISDLTHNDAAAIHDNVAAEISALTEKTTPVGADHALIEDSAASNGKKRMTLSNSWDNFYRAKQDVCFIIAASDETTALTTGTAKATFRVPHAVTLTDVRASVTTAPTGAGITVDITEGGVTVLSTLLTIDATEKTSATAAVAAVISDSALADDAEISINVDVVGSTIAGAGLKVTLIGTRA